MLDKFVTSLKISTSDAVLHRRLVNTANFALVLILASLVPIVWAILWGDEQDRLIYIPLMCFILVCSLFSLWWIRKQQTILAGVPLISAIIIPSIAMSFLDSDLVIYQPVALLWVGLILAGLIFDERIALLVDGIVIAAIVVVAALLARNADETLVTLPDIFSIAALTIVWVGINWRIANGLRLTAQAVATEKDARRLNLLEVSNALTQRIFSRQELETLLAETIELIRQQFAPVYHAQVFLIEKDKRIARLRASTGEAGKQLLARNFGLEVGSRSVIGQVTRTGTHVLVRSADTDPIHQFNEFLSETRTELALPLRVGNEVIGALDIQSKFYDAFIEEEVAVFQAIADQIALAIDNAQILEKLRQRVGENLALYRQELENRQEIERLNVELIGRTWREYLQKQITEAAAPEKAETFIRNPELYSTAAKRAFETGEVYFTPADDHLSIVMPVTIRGVPVAALEFDLPGVASLNKATLDALAIIGERIGLIAENVRLFEQSQQIIERERVVNEITTKLSAHTDIAQILQTAVKELGQALGTPYTRITLHGDSAKSTIG